MNDLTVLDRGRGADLGVGAGARVVVERTGHSF